MGIDIRAVSTPTLLGDSRVIQGYTDIPVGPGVTAPAQITVIGDPHQRSEELVAYELGYRVQATKKISADLAMFYNSYDRVETISSGRRLSARRSFCPRTSAMTGSVTRTAGSLRLRLKRPTNGGSRVRIPCWKPPFMCAIR